MGYEELKISSFSCDWDGCYRVQDIGPGMTWFKAGNILLRDHSWQKKGSDYFCPEHAVRPEAGVRLTSMEAAVLEACMLPGGASVHELKRWNTSRHPGNILHRLRNQGLVVQDGTKVHRNGHSPCWKTTRAGRKAVPAPPSAEFLRRKKKITDPSGRFLYFLATSRAVLLEPWQGQDYPHEIRCPRAHAAQLRPSEVHSGLRVFPCPECLAESAETQAVQG